MLSFQPAFSVSSFTFIKRFFSSSSLYAIRVVSSTTFVINKLYRPAKEYYSAINKNEVLTNAAIWINFENITLSERNLTQRSHIVWILLLEMPQIDNFLGT